MVIRIELVPVYGTATTVTYSILAIEVYRIPVYVFSTY